MNENVPLRLDAEACTGCQICVQICPSDRLVLRDNVVASVSESCIGCDHCASVCPEEAIHIEDGLATPVRFHTLPEPENRVFDEQIIHTLVHIMGTRRSCRAFRKKEIPREILEDLVRIGTLAPSGTNSQKWTFTVLPNRSSVERLGDWIGDFFRQLNRLAESSTARFVSRVFSSDKLGKYYRDYHDRVSQALKEYEETGRDRLFHGAPCAILVGMTPGASCPKEDALLASQNILLAAHAHQLGTCLIGYAVEAMRHDRKIGRKLGLPEDERVYAVIALGYPKVKFLRPAGRKKVIPRFVE